MPGTSVLPEEREDRPPDFIEVLMLLIPESRPLMASAALSIFWIISSKADKSMGIL